MKNYAIIQDGVVSQIYATDGDITTELHPSIIAISLTGITPSPQAGWAADLVEGAWRFSPPSIPQPSNEELAVSARMLRDKYLRSIYDPGILMAQRALRLASSQEEISYAEGKISELDAYAEALQNIPQQPGFPQTIIWPEAPTT